MADLGWGYTGEYARYVLRDLVYVAGGTLVAGSVVLCVADGQALANLASHVSDNALLVAAYVVGALVLGVLAKETVEYALGFLPWVIEKGLRWLETRWGRKWGRAARFVDDHVFIIRTRPPTEVGRFKDHALVVDYIETTYGSGVRALLQRDSFLMHIGAILGSCCLISVPCVACSDFRHGRVVLVLLTVIGVAAILENYMKFRHWRSHLRALAEGRSQAPGDAA
jgi:hypothetical protein